MEQRSLSLRKSRAAVISAVARVLCMAELVAAIFLPAGAGLAQTVGKISGKAVDAETGEPLVGCNVSVTGTMLGAATDPEGTYFILNVPPGRYAIQASMVGYQKVLQQDVIVNIGRTTTVNFRLPSAAVVQGEVVVEAVRPDVEKEKTSTSAIYRPDEVQAVPGIRDVGDLLLLAADVTDGHFRGGRTGEEYYTLQGMGIVNPLDNSTAFLPIMSAVEEVEVVTSGFGAQYGNAQSGVVNISMKEGQADRWRTTVETRMRAPGKKHFGPSLYDANANPYLAALLNVNTWLRGDPQTNTPFYTSMGSGLNSRYALDTLVQLQVARTLWLMQMRRDLGLNYGNKIDYSGEASTGGPIDDHTRMFLAMRTSVSWPVFPTREPDAQRQVIGNTAFDLGSAATLRISGAYSLQNTNVFPSSNGTGYFNWLWDRLLSIDYQETSNLQLGARFTKNLNPSTFYEVKVSSLWTKSRLGSTPAPPSIPDSLIINPQNSQIDWDKIIAQTVTAPDNFSYMKGDDTFRDELTRTVSAEASVTSQVTRSHLLNAGAQFNAYHIDVADNLGVRQGAGGPVQQYTVNPFEGALYAEDKMEFEGLIARAGLRFDFWDENSTYFPDLVVPYRQFNDAYPGDTTFTYNPNAVKKKNAPLIGRLQPRVGVSFPVSVNTVFHLNYGSFMQRPPFQYVVSSRVQQGTLTPQLLGNPRLEPETTNSYDVGIMQGLGEGFTLDVSGYYKDVKNLIELATFTSSKLGLTYSTYFNRDYADIRGFRVALTKRTGGFTGSLNYQFSVATGKSATVSNAPPSFIEAPTYPYALTTRLDNVPTRDILLNFDRTHNLIVNLAYTSGREWGPRVFGVTPLEDLTISAYSFARSGRPYTSSTNTKLINGARTPAEYNTNARLTKEVRNFFGLDAKFYVEVFNLFDDKILNYDYVFATPNAGSTNNLVRAYEHYALDDPAHGVLYWPDTNPPLNWAVNQSFLVYDNAPRSFDFGVLIEF